MSREQFKQLQEFKVKYAPHITDLNERRKLSQVVKKKEIVVENLREKLCIYGCDDEVLGEGLRQEGLSE